MSGLGEAWFARKKKKKKNFFLSQDGVKKLRSWKNFHSFFSYLQFNICNTGEKKKATVSCGDTLPIERERMEIKDREILFIS